MTGVAPVVDGHNDLLWELRTRCGYDFATVDVGVVQPVIHTDIPRLRAGGVGAQFWSVWVPCDEPAPPPVPTTLEQVDAAYAMLARYDEDLVLATTADDVERAFAAGRIASLLGAEGGHQIGGSLGVLRTLYRLGVRYLTLTHTRNTDWADSATDEPVHGGLTDFGRTVVREMNRLGMLVDLSHTAATTMHDALEVSTAPAFFSHSNARALCSHPRNVPDDVLARVRDTDGVVMLTFVPGFLTEECHAWMDALQAEEARLRQADPAAPAAASAAGSVSAGSAAASAAGSVSAGSAAASAAGSASAGSAAASAAGSASAGIERWLAAHPRPPCTVSDVADHVCHVRDVAGVRAVGLGGDFDGMIRPPDGLTDVSGYPNLFAELADRGWSESELSGLASGNVLRVLRDTQDAAAAGPDG